MNIKLKNRSKPDTTHNTTPLFIITGPTAAGKTGISIRLAHTLAQHTHKNAEIISADSRQVYTGLDIGSGKITHKEMEGIPHHCLDIADPQTRFTAHDFKITGEQALQEIDARNTIPIICGGTGFYIDTLIGKITLPNIPPTPQNFIDTHEKFTEQELLAQLSQKNPERAQSIDVSNKRRLIRALYIAEYNSTHDSESGQNNRDTNSEHSQAEITTDPNEPQSTYRNHPILWIGICPSLTELRQKIHTRLHERYTHGMLQETKNLLKQGISPLRLKELGLEYAYMTRIIEEHAEGTPHEQKILIELEQKIWQYAKRQLTWHKKNKDIQWFDPSDFARIEKTCLEFYTRAYKNN